MSGRYSLQKDGGMSYVTYMIGNENMYRNCVLDSSVFLFAEIHCWSYLLMWEIHIKSPYDDVMCHV